MYLKGVGIDLTAYTKKKSEQNSEKIKRRTTRGLPNVHLCTR